ncbi:MAG: hypothetical protein HXX81_07810 [Campylobacterales bacterium]|nr:hypothetical protein [Campylobacterales bacterium]
MHTLTIKVNDEGYSHLMYILQNLSSVEVSENIAIDENKSRKKFLNRIKSSKMI